MRGEIPHSVCFRLLQKARSLSVEIEGKGFVKCMFKNFRKELRLRSKERASKINLFCSKVW
jgi:hypothetical protein